MLFVVFIVLPGDSTTPGDLKTAPPEVVEEASGPAESATAEPEPVTEVEVSEPVEEEPAESGSSRVTTPPQIPASLAGAKIIEIQDLGSGCYRIIFEGDTEGDGSAESISQSVLFFQASAQILSDGIQVSGTYIVDSGTVRAMAIRVDDANSKKTDDGKGTVTVAESGDIATEWLSPGVLQLKITGVEIPDGTISVQVVIQETAGGGYYSFEPGE